MRTIVVRSVFYAAFLFPLAGAANLVGVASATTNDLLAQARAATAQYHDSANALAAGYIDLGPNPAEGGGIEFVNFNLVDCSLDVTLPEALRYVPSGNRIRLAAVEYVIPFDCAPEPPEDFLPGIGEWEPEPGVPAWTKMVPLWSGNSLGTEGHD